MIIPWQSHLPMSLGKPPNFSEQHRETTFVQQFCDRGPSVNSTLPNRPLANSNPHTRPLRTHIPDTDLVCDFSFLLILDAPPPPHIFQLFNLVLNRVGSGWECLRPRSVRLDYAKTVSICFENLDSSHISFSKI